jgi:hypothetical protein
MKIIIFMYNGFDDGHIKIRELILSREVQKSGRPKSGRRQGLDQRRIDG